jgi:uncharacterized protein YciI/uncharacterized protein YndB with AHSA1/START domain
VSTVPPLRREILVDTDPATAFEVFTAQIGQWWPLAEKSVFGADAAVAFDDGQIIERSADGQTDLWGTVTRWDPPRTLAFSWHPGGAPTSYVEISFTAAADRTRVAVVHSGWEAYGDPAAARAMYDEGWPEVLDRLESAAHDTWVALMHRRGPVAPVTGSLFEDPRFREHAAFLGRMREAGYLVMAGPMVDGEGEGMTILRLPGPEHLGTATKLATEDDASVAGGFLAVTVRPWNPMMRPYREPAAPGGSA